jgi:hypothetical protein
LPADATPTRSDEELLATVQRRVASVRAVRARRTLVALGAATALTFLLASGVAVAGNDGDANHSVRAAGEVATSTTMAEETTTSTEVTTTTEAAPVAAPTTTSSVVSSTPTTRAPARTQPTAPKTSGTIPRSGSVSPGALVAEVWPPNRDTARVYVSARGGATNGYVSRMSITWGDGSPAWSVDYPPTSCQDPSTAHPNDVQVANTDHRYATTGSYTVQLVVTALRCDGQQSESATASITVHYPSAPPSS